MEQKWLISIKDNDAVLLRFKRVGRDKTYVRELVGEQEKLNPSQKLSQTKNNIARWPLYIRAVSEVVARLLYWMNRSQLLLW